MKNPHPEKGVVENLFGVEVADPYRWLEEESEEMRLWRDEQNAKARHYLATLPGRDAIRNRFAELRDVDTLWLPRRRGDRYFYTQRKQGKQLPGLYMREALDAPEVCLIDLDTYSPDKKATLKDWKVSRDGKKMLFAVSPADNDKSEIRLMDLDTREILPDLISADLYPAIMEWAHDTSGFWYGRRDPEAPVGEEKFHKRIYYHKIGTSHEEDQYVFGKGLAREEFPGIEISKDGRWRLFSRGNHAKAVATSSLFLFDTQHPEKGMVTVVDGIEARFYGHIHKDRVFISSEHGSPNWQLFSVPLESAGEGMSSWKLVVPEDPQAVIEDIVRTDEHIFIHRLRNVHSELERFSLDGAEREMIALPAIGTISSFGSSRDFSELFFTFSSYTVIPAVYRYDFVKKMVQEFSRIPVPFDPAPYETRQVWYPSKDGTQIPMFLVHKRGLVPDGRTPVMLNGYGGFSISYSPSFEQYGVLMLEAGGIYAVANLRGGGEFGEEWHKAGTREHKQNTFDDFIAAAEYLVREGYTNPGKIAIRGASNGGLLCGAVITQRPELFRAAVVRSPVADMLRYHLFHGGRHWIRDYGVAETKEEFEYLYTYSPVHHVKDGTPYPAILFLTGDKDDRVHPMNVYKLTARFVEATTSGEPILLRVEKDSGHFTAASLDTMNEQDADIFAFVFERLGIK